MLELLLLQDVAKLGRKGSIVKVKAGYGRNYLIPQHIATLVTKANLHFLEIEKKKGLAKELSRKDDFKKVAESLEMTACTIEAKSNEEGHLFGSVNYAMIHESFKKLGFEINEESIILEDPNLYPIKRLGIFSVIVKLHPEIFAKTKVWVVNERKSE